MCRMMAVKSAAPFKIRPFLKAFSNMTKESPEYQGDGWGYAVRKHNQWDVRKSITPIWKDSYPDHEKTTLLIAHARSAFRNEGIEVKNNMPFINNNNLFVFNGELHKVRIREEGRIGAEKIFNVIQKFNKGEFLKALEKGTSMIEKRSGHIRAMNILISDGESIYGSSLFNEDSDYFTMVQGEKNGIRIVCSSPMDISVDWQTINNRSFFRL